MKEMDLGNNLNFNSLTIKMFEKEVTVWSVVSICCHPRNNVMSCRADMDQEGWLMLQVEGLQG